MTDLTTAAKKKCALAFEIAVKNCIQKPAKGQKARKVNISEKDSQTMYAFYLKHVKDDRNEALAQIGLASRRAAGSGAVLSISIFVLAAAFMFALVRRDGGRARRLPVLEPPPGGAEAVGGAEDLQAGHRGSAGKDVPGAGFEPAQVCEPGFRGRRGCPGAGVRL